MVPTVTLVFATVLLLFLSRGRALFPLLVVGVGFIFLVTWVREFLFLMLQPDTAFRGPHDKLIWAFLLIVLPPIGLIAFWSYRRAHLPGTDKPKPDFVLRDFN